MRNLFVGSIAAVSLLCGAAFAQNTQPGQAQPGQQRIGQQPGQPGQLRQDQQGRQGQGSQADQQIAACLYLEANNEIELAKFAESKAQSNEVRQFAQQMVRDHTPGRDELKQIAGNFVSEGARQRVGEGGADWIGIKKELAAQCLESTKKELSGKQSHEFDQCFMTQQAMAHHKMVDELTVLRNHVSGELRQKLDKDLQTAQHHLQMAKDLAKKVSDQPASERVTRRPDGSK